MSESTFLACCDDEARRREARRAALNGLDYVEVSDDGLTLTVYFLGAAPEGLRKENLVIRGGARIRDLAVLAAEVFPAPDDQHDGWMEVRLDRSGDFSTYTLCVVALDRDGHAAGRPPKDFDLRYACVDFTFPDAAGSGTTDIDCASAPACPAPARDTPEISYLAKDYASFRQLMLDRLSLLLPEWSERHVPDIGITLVEILAYAGDHLSYYQDAVATEAYLDTARLRRSVRRHTRLVDYVLHEGCNARAWVVCRLEQAESLELFARDVFFTTRAEGLLHPSVRAEDLPRVRPLPYLVFGPLAGNADATIVLREAHNEIHFYTWMGAQCCLRQGATFATLIDRGRARDLGEYREANPRANDYVLQLAPCDILVFEEVKGPRTGSDADADPAHRHAVRLTKVTRSVDPLPDSATGRPTLLVEIEWAVEDALPFALCLSSMTEDCKPLEWVSVARGNVVLVDHGRSVEEPLPPVPVVEIPPQCCDDCVPRETERRAGPYEAALHEPDVTFAQPLPPCRVPDAGCGDGHRTTPATVLLRQDPRRALPEVALAAFPAAPDGNPAFAPADLIDGEPLARRIAKAGQDGDESAPAAWLRTQLSRERRDALDQWAATDPPKPLPADLAGALRKLLLHLRRPWSARQDLLATDGDDADFAVEMEEDRTAHLRFGDGTSGRMPDAGATFVATYRIGNGPVGNVGAEAIAHIVFRRAFPDGVRVVPRNPLPATGGTAPESVQDAKLLAPHRFRQRLERAVTSDDYAAIVLRDFAAEVQRAAAQIRWTGSGAEVRIAVDALHSDEPDPVLLCRIERHLQAFRRIGHDVRVVPARSVPLSIAIKVRVKAGYVRGHVKQALLQRFETGVLADGRLGYFHPDNLTFGTGIEVSDLAAAAQAVTGVESVRVTRLERFLDGPRGELDAGVLTLGPAEVARLDNDPNFPEHGSLDIVVDTESGR